MRATKGGAMMPVVKCGACDGTGTCKRCKGTGQISEEYCISSYKGQLKVRCSKCGGRGTYVILISPKQCKKCGGTGYIPGAMITVAAKKAQRMINCPRCGGNCSCSGCNGSGWIRYSEG